MTRPPRWLSTVLIVLIGLFTAVSVVKVIRQIEERQNAVMGVAV